VGSSVLLVKHFFSANYEKGKTLLNDNVLHKLDKKFISYFFVFFLGACSNVGLDTGFFAVDIGVLTSFVILL